MNQKPDLDLAKAEALAVMQMRTDQIACAMDIDLNALRGDEERYNAFMTAVYRGRAKGEAEIRSQLFKRAREGDCVAIRELLNYR